MQQNSVSIISRIVIDILLLILFFVAPAWLVFIVSFILVFFLRPFFEFLILAICLDLFYGISMSQFWGFSFIYTILGLIGFTVVSFINERIRYNA